MCVRVQSLKATRVLSCLGPEHLNPSSYRPLTYHGAISGLLCSALAAYHSCCEERTFGWVAVNEVAIAHDQTTGEAALDLYIDVM